MESPLSGGIDFNFHVDRCAGLDAHSMLDGIVRALTGIDDRPHPVQVHRMCHHRLIEHDRIGIVVFHIVDRPDVTLHNARQTEFNGA